MADELILKIPADLRHLEIHVSVSNYNDYWRQEVKTEREMHCISYYPVYYEDIFNTGFGQSNSSQLAAQH